MFKYKGWIGNYFFLETSGAISIEDRVNLARNAFEMYVDKEWERDVEGDNFEGVIRTEGKIEYLVNFGGQRFDVDVDTSNGRSNLSFLVCDLGRRDHFEPGVLN